MKCFYSASRFVVILKGRRDFSANSTKKKKTKQEFVYLCLTGIPCRIADQSSKIRITNFDFVRVSESSEVSGEQNYRNQEQCLKMTKIQFEISREKTSEFRSMRVVIFAFLLHQN